MSKFTAACLACAVTLVFLAALAERERRHDRAHIEKMLMPPPPQTQSVVPVPGQCKGFHATPMVVTVPFATGPDLP